MIRNLFALMILLVLAVSHASAQRNASLSSAMVPGCYALTFGKWREPPWHSFPTVIELRSQPHPGRGSQDNLFVVQPVPFEFYRADAKVPVFWTLRPSDSVRVVWSTGEAMLRLDLRIGHDTLRGFATAVRNSLDIHPPRTTVAAARAKCPPGGVQDKTLEQELERLRALKGYSRGGGSGG